MAYTYQAENWCDECGKKIMSQIALENPERVPEDPEDETTFDSNDYPKWFDAEEEKCDGPSNCGDGECGGQYWLGGRFLDYGTFLKNPLTSRGYQNVQEMLNEWGKDLPPFAKEWADFYGFSFHENSWSSPQAWLEEQIDNAAAGLPTSRAASNLVDYARTLLGAMDADQIQDLFQSDMEDDGYFVKEGWYSNESERTEKGGWR